ncbi:MAG: hypothetical protein OXU75_13715 [Deltaproteobacteria bacterium]|nr:hypothetical protein [Deltaproteobacteria bacterium]
MIKRICISVVAFTILLIVTTTSTGAQQLSITLHAPLKGSDLIFPHKFPSEKMLATNNAWKDLQAACPQCATGGTVGLDATSPRWVDGKVTSAPFKAMELVFPQNMRSQEMSMARQAWKDLQTACPLCANGGTVGTRVVGRGYSRDVITITKTEWIEYMMLKASCKQ